MKIIIFSNSSISNDVSFMLNYFSYIFLNGINSAYIYLCIIVRCYKACKKNEYIYDIIDANKLIIKT